MREWNLETAAKQAGVILGSFSNQLNEIILLLRSIDKALNRKRRKVARRRKP